MYSNVCIIPQVGGFKYVLSSRKSKCLHSHILIDTLRENMRRKITAK